MDSLEAFCGALLTVVALFMMWLAFQGGRNSVFQDCAQYRASVDGEKRIECSVVGKESDATP